MSDNDKGGSIRNGDDNVCRDFLRNVCTRGQNCKYSHPKGQGAEMLGLLSDIVFCHDFQNVECYRPSCRFIHCTREEEEHYHRTGDLPDHVLRTLSAKMIGVKKGEVPICKDYLKGDCRRGSRCKFRHLSPGQLDDVLDRASSSRPNRSRFQDVYDRHDQFDIYDRRESYEPDLKRRHFDERYSLSMMMSNADPYSSPKTSELQIVQEENSALRRKVEALRKQVADLTATNEFLLDQNAQLRLSKSTTAVTQAPPPGLNPQPATPAPVPPIIAQISQQLPITANSAELTAASALQPAQPISVPVSLAQALAPVSLASVSIAQQLPAPVSMAQSLPQSIITMSGPSTPLVSYPIMTQSMRPPLPQSSLAH